MVGLHYLKHAYNVSDESVVARWVENPYWQYFCGYTHMQHACPIHPTSMTRWRQRIGVKVDGNDHKAHKRCEFGQKVAAATTNRGDWFVGALLCEANPYDGHTLDATLAQVKSNTGVPLSNAYVDKGYRSHDY